MPSPLAKPRTTTNHHSSLFCHRHSAASAATLLTPTATLDLLIFLLVLFSGTFLLSSYFSYIFRSLSLLLPPLLPHHHLLIVVAVAVTVVLAIAICAGKGTRCGDPRCKGMKKAMEFDLQIQTEESLKRGGAECEVVDRLPWKGGSEGNPDYECLRAELRRMAPVNGRAVLLFRARCGCPVAKLIGLGPKKGRRLKRKR
ncbi:hypothetical protein AKJ16_DCAP02554 [Drosera capensis]